ncbi:MAG: MFS transporter [Acidobacteriota bacterium]
MSIPPALRRIAAALSYRDFRVMWAGACVSSIGTWMQKVAQSWLVLTLTGSPFYLGLDAFLGELPILLFTLLGGVVADRYNRRAILLISQCVQLSTAFALAALVHWHVMQVWHVLMLSFITGTAQAFGGPAYQSLLPSLVEKHDVPNAIALNSIQFNVARIVGPLLAGVALAVWGSAACFALNGASFLVVIASLLMLRAVQTLPAHTQSMLKEMRRGLGYVRASPLILTLTFLALCTTMLASPVLTLLPVMAQQVFALDAAGYARLMAFSGSGAVVGALGVAWLGRFPRMGTTVLGVQMGLGLVLAAFASSRFLPLSYALLFLGSIGLMMSFSLLMSLVQLAAPDAMRGRVVSIYMMAFRGGMPLGSLAAGYAAYRTSAPITLMVAGLLLSLVATIFLIRGRTVREF